jgi:peptidoglycan L-alanyl-D-glutamate endopeptidase CwlK
MTRSLDDLSSRMKPLAEQLLAQARAAGLDPVVTFTGRTYEEQLACVAHGTSWTMKSKHLPQPPEQKSEAIDIAPRVVMSMKWWAPNHPSWDKLGAIGEGLGLRWGGRWEGRKRDPGHFELNHDPGG